jgi:predicted transcriptional regulator
MNTPHDVIERRIDTSQTKYLLGELGIQTLALISEGCSSDEEIKCLSTISQSCLDVKIPLLATLGLITKNDGSYIVAERGKSFLMKVRGWQA